MKSRATQTKELDMVNGPLARKILIYSIPTVGFSGVFGSTGLAGTSTTFGVGVVRSVPTATTHLPSFDERLKIS